MRRLYWFGGLCFVLAILPACGGDAAEGPDAAEVAASAARGGFIAWTTSRNLDVRDIQTDTQTIRSDGADVRLTAETRGGLANPWMPLDITVPVSRNADNAWLVPSTQVIDRLVDSARAATSVEPAPTETLPTATSMPAPPPATPTPAPPEIPPPPDGTVIYLSDWSTGIDGWIGASDWSVESGYLVNDGSQLGRDPWLEAPAQVQPWQSMVVEFQAEVLADSYGSFGLVARAGGAGWNELGLRWQATESDIEESAENAVVSLGATLRRSTQRVTEEWFASPIALAPGPHLYRFEFTGDEISMFIDGVEVGEIEDGSFAAGEFLGLWSEQTPLRVGWFRVTVV